MATSDRLAVEALDLATLAAQAGVIGVFVEPGEPLDRAAARIDRLTDGGLARLVESPAFAKLKPGEALTMGWPPRMAAEAVVAARLPRRAEAAEAQRAGAAVAKAAGKSAAVLCAPAHRQAAQIAFGAALRAYAFTAHKTGDADGSGPVRLLVRKPEEAEAALAPLRALVAGVHFTRDLVNEPSNVLSTKGFAKRLKALRELGVEVEVLDEPELEKLGMHALLGVGQGSASPSKVVVMHWKGGKKSAPTLALVGKGVVFDTGGISIKPAAGMEDMTSDMGGAGVVAGAMVAIALRKAPANVVGLVGLVENMPSGTAQRPGDVVRSMKGDTIEVINTDAEGRLVLADVLWYAQERFKPDAIVDLATLTGACVVALGHHNAAVFANDDALCAAFLRAAEAEGEGAWRMPLGPDYDRQLKSRIADMKNVGGRAAGAVTAAQFLQRFVKEGTPWVHLDIAGVTLVQEDTPFAPKGATGWGVRAIDRLVRDRFEG